MFTFMIILFLRFIILFVRPFRIGQDFHIQLRIVVNVKCRHNSHIKRHYDLFANFFV